jgi:hypothetical protein
MNQQSNKALRDTYVWLVGRMIQKLAIDRNPSGMIVSERSRLTIWIRARFMRASMVVRSELDQRLR